MDFQLTEEEILIIASESVEYLNATTLQRTSPGPVTAPVPEETASEALPSNIPNDNWDEYLIKACEEHSLLQQDSNRNAMEREIKRYFDGDGYITSDCPRELAQKYLNSVKQVKCTNISRTPPVSKRRAPTSYMDIPLSQDSPSRIGFGGSSSSSSRSRCTTSRIPVFDPKDTRNPWEVLVDVIGPNNWPNFIWDAFNNKNFNNHNRMIAVNFAVLNGVAWDTFDRAMFHTLGQHYLIKGRRFNCQARYAALTTDAAAEFNRSRVYSYNVRERQMENLNYQRVDKSGNLLPQKK